MESEEFDILPSLSADEEMPRLPYLIIFSLYF